VEKIKMKQKKSIMALCIFALAIGIATALPLAYITPRTVATAQTDVHGLT
jgi:hypothetical protein